MKLPNMQLKALAWKISKESSVFLEDDDGDDTCSVGSDDSHSSDNVRPQTPIQSSHNRRSTPTSPTVQRYERVPGRVRQNVSKYEALAARSRSPSPAPSSLSSSQTYVSPRSSFTSESESVSDRASRSAGLGKVDLAFQFGPIPPPAPTPPTLTPRQSFSEEMSPTVTISSITDENIYKNVPVQELSPVSSLRSRRRVRPEYKYLFKDRKRPEDSLPSPPSSPPRPQGESQSRIRDNARRTQYSQRTLRPAPPPPEPSVQLPQLNDLRIAVQNILSFLQSSPPQIGPDWQHYTALLVRNVENIARQLNDNDQLDVQSFKPYQWSRMICEVGHIAVMMACPTQPTSESPANAFFDISRFYLLGLRSVQYCPCGLTTK
ncbi:hypothetical protein AA313_de0206677 [Arthrobotrys entomopaga]|nr:hypothetical protein AA313_de0206677 [Arthrobotrys entomopaga]